MNSFNRSSMLILMFLFAMATAAKNSNADPLYSEDILAGIYDQKALFEIVIEDTQRASKLNPGQLKLLQRELSERASEGEILPLETLEAIVSNADYRNTHNAVYYIVARYHDEHEAYTYLHQKLLRSTSTDEQAIIAASVIVLYRRNMEIAKNLFQSCYWMSRGNHKFMDYASSNPSNDLPYNCEIIQKTMEELFSISGVHKVNPYSIVKVLRLNCLEANLFFVRNFEKLPPNLKSDRFKIIYDGLLPDANGDYPHPELDRVTITMDYILDASTTLHTLSLKSLSDEERSGLSSKLYQELKSTVSINVKDRILRVLSQNGLVDDFSFEEIALALSDRSRHAVPIHVLSKLQLPPNLSTEALLNIAIHVDREDMVEVYSRIMNSDPNISQRLIQNLKSQNRDVVSASIRILKHGLPRVESDILQLLTTGNLAEMKMAHEILSSNHSENHKDAYLALLKNQQHPIPNELFLGYFRKFPVIESKVVIDILTDNDPNSASALFSILELSPIDLTVLEFVIKRLQMDRIYQEFDTKYFKRYARESPQEALTVVREQGDSGRRVRLFNIFMDAKVDGKNIDVQNHVADFVIESDSDTRKDAYLWAFSKYDWPISKSTSLRILDDIENNYASDDIDHYKKSFIRHVVEHVEPSEELTRFLLTEAQNPDIKFNALPKLFYMREYLVPHLSTVIEFYETEKNPFLRAEMLENVHLLKADGKPALYLYFEQLEKEKPEGSHTSKYKLLEGMLEIGAEGDVRFAPYIIKCLEPHQSEENTILGLKLLQSYGEPIPEAMALLEEILNVPQSQELRELAVLVKESVGSQD